MKKIFIILIAAAAFYFLDPLATSKLKSDVPFQLTYYSKVIGNSSSEELPMVIVLHGAGGDEKDALQTMETVDADYRYVSFRGPFTIRSGYRWTKGSGPTVEDAMVDYVDTLDEVAASIADGTEELMDRFGSDGKPILLGFSAGAELAYYLAGAYPESFSAVYAIAGEMRSEEFEESFEHGHSLPVFGFGGTQDTLVSAQNGQEAVDTLRGYGRRANFQSYEGGHTVPDMVLNHLADYLS